MVLVPQPGRGRGGKVHVLTTVVVVCLYVYCTRKTVRFKVLLIQTTKPCTVQSPQTSPQLFRLFSTSCCYD